MERLQRGDLIETGGQKAVIVKIGRGTVRSAFLYFEDNRTKLITEVDWWHKQGAIKFLKRDPNNLKFAQEYCAQYTATIPDL